MLLAAGRGRVLIKNNRLLARLLSPCRAGRDSLPIPLLPLRQEFSGGFENQPVCLLIPCLIAAGIRRAIQSFDARQEAYEGQPLQAVS